MAADVSLHAHAGRAEEHAKLADVLESSGHEWSAVAYFYAAYHLARDALRTDPIFSDLPRLRSISPDLVPDDRDASMHKGRRRPGAPREFGVSDLVRLMYPGVATAYNELHQASIQVRYLTGLFIPLAKVGQRYAEVFAAHSSGSMRA